MRNKQIQRLLGTGVCVALFIPQITKAQVPFTEIADTGDLGSIITLNDCSSWGDFDGDGDMDLIIGQAFQLGNLILRNDGTGKFTRMTSVDVGDLANSVGDPTATLWADMDNDGDLDLYIANYSAAGSYSGWFDNATPTPGLPDHLYLNNGNGQFTITSMQGISRLFTYSIGANLIDYDRDGLLDVFVATLPINIGYNGPDLLFHNEGGLSFSSVTLPAISTRAQTSSWVDYDQDGDLDALVAESRSSRLPVFYRNQTGEEPSPLFAETSSFENGQSFVDSSGHSAWGDYDNDGDLDLYVQTGSLYRTTGGGGDLWTNLGGGDFERRAFFTNANRRSGTAVWLDYDNDGDLDLLTEEDERIGSEVQQVGHTLFEGDGNGGFTPHMFLPSQSSLLNYVNVADIDNDGFMDVLLLDFSENYLLGELGGDRLFRNDGNANHWIKINPEGTASNRSAIGATVRVMAIINGEEKWQMRQIMSGDGSPFTQHDQRPNFGLGNATVVDTVRIEWPSGTVQELTDVAVDQILSVTEPLEVAGERVAEGMKISWPASAHGFELVGAGDPSGPWDSASEEVTVSNGQSEVTVPTETPIKLFKLQRP